MIYTIFIFSKIKMYTPTVGYVDLFNASTYLTEDDISTLVDGISVDFNTDDQLEVKDLGITNSKLGLLSVATGNIQNNAVTTVKINDSAITTAKILDANITTTKILDDAVTTSKILNVNVTTAKIADSAITTTKINDLAVTNAKINDVATSKITSGPLTVTTLTTTDSTIDSNKFSGGVRINGAVDNVSTGNFRPTAIKGSSSSQEWLSFYTNTNGAGWHINGFGTGLSRSDWGFNIVETGVANYRFFINRGGNVCIGNDNNTYKLDVSGTGRFTGRLNCNSDVNINGATSGIYDYVLLLNNSAGTNKWKIAYHNTAGGLDIQDSTGDSKIYINPGGNISIGNSNNTFKLDVQGTGRFTSYIYANSGIELPSTGGVPSVLDHYEETSGTLTFTGPWASNQTCNYRLVRNGKIISLVIFSIAVAATISSTITSVSLLASRFRPYDRVEGVCRIIDNGNYSSGFITIESSGGITIDKADLTGFSGSGSTGFNYPTITYPIN